jgi:hypothetical protein
MMLLTAGIPRSALLNFKDSDKNSEKDFMKICRRWGY